MAEQPGTAGEPDEAFGRGFFVDSDSASPMRKRATLMGPERHAVGTHCAKSCDAYLGSLDDLCYQFPYQKLHHRSAEKPKRNGRQTSSSDCSPSPRDTPHTAAPLDEFAGFIAAF
jgi:hypothetical protein